MTAKIKQLTVGQKVEIQISGLNVPARFQTDFIGAVMGRWFIVNMPDSRRYGELREHLYEGVPIIVRFVLENESGEICAFRSDIDFVVAHPTKMLFLDWPKQVESRVIRQGRRFDAYLPCTIERLAEDNTVASSVEAIILDVSETGCKLRYSLDEPVDEEQENPSEWETGQRANLIVNQKSGNTIKLGSIVRQVKTSSDEVTLGVQFNSHQKEAINGLFSGSLVDIDALSRAQS
ncbi:PilZ domain-containing protein [Idiomarina fontislapidosi]|uniref:Flagellar brake protein n=1 Tax=Idiomarina fontislapidosi TaxID=263723 RepID=A0A432Y9U1_9GAMM|nr:flagellar brake protein [Idiomarina fontislapidosi]PYE34313.1 PilZ domain-containing protein [Idiomarina fontislapidosi]RUO57724.1 flagellar brake protein [Idiomarina fontislapidosi]|tara:strand:+ start:1422 stop:2123 length:702 start_codon:yes stop_codon:yes gene_type:complete